MANRFAVVALLQIRPDKLRELEAFETEAVEISARHGGELLQRVQLEEGGEWSELHVWEYPDRASFEAYCNDPERKRLIPLRDEAISATQIMLGAAGNAFNRKDKAPPR